MSEPEMLRRAADYIHETFHGVDEHEGFAWLAVEDWLRDEADADDGMVLTSALTVACAILGGAPTDP